MSCVNKNVTSCGCQTRYIRVEPDTSTNVLQILIAVNCNLLKFLKVKDNTFNSRWEFAEINVVEWMVMFKCWSQEAPLERYACPGTKRLKL